MQILFLQRQLLFRTHGLFKDNDDCQKLCRAHCLYNTETDFLVSLFITPVRCGTAVFTVGVPLLGSLLLDNLKEHISTTAQDHCKAIYLHVLTTNNTAIHFYESRDFRQHHYLPYYYSIRGVLKDGFTYVLYINGGHPPWTILYPFFPEFCIRKG